MKKLSLKKVFLQEKVNKIIVFMISFIFIYSLLVTGLTTKKYNLKEGDIAKVDIKAPREVKDELSTETRIRQAEDSVPIQYNKKPEVKTGVISKLNSFFSKIDQVNSSQLEEKDKIQKLKSEDNIGLADDDYQDIIKLNKDELKQLQDFLQKSLSDMYDSNNISDNTQRDNREDIKRAQEIILLKVSTSNSLSKNLKDIATKIGYSQISPNFFYDKDKTEELRREVVKKVSPVIIKKDQIIVKEGEPVTKYQIEVLRDLGLLNNSSHFQWHIYISLGILILLVLVLEWTYFSIYCPKIYNDLKMLIMVNILSLLAIFMARTIGIISTFLIPLTFVPMIVSLLVGKKVSLVISTINCVLISVAVQFSLDITVLAVVNAVVGSIILKKMQQRMDILFSCLYMTVINVILTFSMGFLISDNMADVVEKAVYIGISTIISGILVIGFLPLFEGVFNIVTTIKLLELSNPNNPLLKRLLMEAPGSYHHSLLVGNLAEVAAEEVGGNPLLARVAAYYHDIGKIRRPYFFKENQLGKDNPHSKLTPSLSALIIISHVKDGIEMAREYKLPKIIIDAIQQHHGTSLVKYFYVTMKNSSEKPEDVKEDDFRYPGPIPETKESGIIMLADGVEAAVRSINDPTEDKIEKMVNNIIKDRLDEGQLNNCELTLKDIGKIKIAFIKALQGIYHHRIEYPEDKFSKKSINQLKSPT
ncbi:MULTISPECIES: HD family phosphohydrolase [Clostridium]|uniref:Predicted membrane-associated phosphohydrolase n=4 Tax=Clostridium TaxID=1485 RepID=D8GP29_CLOLD|nr:MULTISPECIES: HDIG domain-containing metalloprotein [Clostridium]ADK13875.1 predicted membrane-associated phosphohydrolase [Clostridium ljungdahlii DSM 13528]AGY77107.1 HDIG domain-containing protein [Clostridium autoethanogenum DSM 10061]ALU37249.1 7TM receptor with intracellular metal dependent phosphohydrolase [Clostridium autoethanogenum DSM 10061]OAA87365.1 Ribonuclease Y [Clostridium ljungdahlii DSM 13528]OVY50183.1 Ribonuclease Y [Clostridium autoethanogenum]